MAERRHDISRRQVLQAGLGASALFLPAPCAWVRAQSDGANGLYTENLLREMRVPETKIEDIIAITDTQISYDNGLITDLLGNRVRARDGERSTGEQATPYYRSASPGGKECPALDP